MIKRRAEGYGFTGFFLALVLAGCEARDSPPPITEVADLVVVNADVYTSDGDRARAEAFAVRDGRFLAVGSSDEIRALTGEDTEIIDAGGNTVLPGLIDGHTHLLSGAALATGVDLSEIEDKNEWLSIIAAKAETLDDGEWILGGAWDHNLSDGVLPTRQMLDRVAPDNPVLLRDIDGHSTWANSLAIELAGITPEASLRPGSEIVTDPETGEPTGIFKEAGYLFSGAPGLDDARDPVEGIRATVALANSLGITTVHDMSGNHDAFLEVLEDGDLSLRVWQGYLGGRYADADVNEYAAEAARERIRIRERVAASGVEEQSGPIFDLGYVKLMVDGVLSTYTALMKAPYSDNPDAHPEPFVSANALSTMVAAAHDNNFPVAVHAIGDEAVSLVLDAFAEHPREPGQLPDRIEHIEVVTPDDVDRFAELGVTASMQPHHATCCVGNYVIDRIGRDRLPNAYVWRSMIDEGVNLVLGSDWSTSPFNPLIQIADTIHRETRLDGVERPWDEGMTLTFEEALAGYTTAAASATAWQDEIGSISPDKWADFIILDGRLQEPVDRRVEDRKVMATYLAGSRVYPSNE